MLETLMNDQKIYEVNGTATTDGKWSGWFAYHCVAISEADAKKGAIAHFTQYTTAKPAIVFTKCKLIEWVSFIT